MSDNNSATANKIQKGSRKSGNIVSSANDIWPDGWFVSDGENIVGPLSAEDAFESVSNFNSSFIESEENLLVSRKGFKKWYGRDELKKLFIEGRSFDEELEASLKQDLMGELSQIEGILASVKETSDSKSATKKEKKDKILVKKTLGPGALAKPYGRGSEKKQKENLSKKIKGASAETPKALTKNMVKPVLENEKKDSVKLDKNKSAIKAAAKIAAKKVAKETPELQDKKLIKDTLLKANKAEEKSNVDAFVTGMESRRIEARDAAKQVRNFKPSEENSFAYYHMILRGRLRLGDIKKPASEMLSGLFTLGLFSPLFINRASAEVKWHMEPSAEIKTSLFKSVLMMIPFLNVIFFNLLSKEVIKMEEQNNYRSTSSFVATLFAFIPGLSSMYLQMKINKHWKLHAFSVMKKENVGSEE